MSDIDYGPPREESEVERLLRILEVCFQFPSERSRVWRERVGDESIRLVRRDGRVAGGLGILDFGQFWGGRRLRMAGIVAVGVAPEARGTGVAAALLRGTLRDLRAAGVPISVLYASTQRLYRSVGYEQAGLYTEYEVDRTTLVPGDRELPMTPVDPPSREALEKTHLAWASRLPGGADRPACYWDHVLDPPEGRYLAWLAGDPTRPEGYVLSMQKRGGDDFVIHVRDLVALTPAALARIWTFLADHRSLVEKVTVRGGPSDPGLMVLPEHDWKVAETHRWMLRVTDVAAALEGRGYPPSLRAAVSLEVEDDALPENAGKYVLRVSGGRGKIERGGEGRVRVDARGLAPLFTGFLTPGDLNLAGRLSGPAEDLILLGEIFAGPAPWMSDTF